MTEYKCENCTRFVPDQNGEGYCMLNRHDPKPVEADGLCGQFKEVTRRVDARKQ